MRLAYNDRSNFHLCFDFRGAKTESGNPKLVFSLKMSHLTKYTTMCFPDLMSGLGTITFLVPQINKKYL